MTPAPRPAWASAGWWCGSGAPLLLVALKGAVTAAVLASGFQALSDDDFARVAIAQEFAASPRLDPSGTSWLPFPFWVLGAALAALGPTFEAARGVAVLLGVASVLLLHRAALWLTGCPRAALLGAALATLVPYGAWLGAATVPESLTAALCVVGLASATPASPAPRRLLGALAVTAAALSRYEAWPIALSLAVWHAWDARRGGSAARTPLLAAAALAASGPLAWLAHGAAVHGDALFFVERVAEYRRAVAPGDGAWLERAARFPLAFLRCEPELVGIAAVGLLAARRAGVRLEAARRPALGLLGLLTFLVAGDLRDSAPTHHPERVLLPGWWLLALAAGWAWRALAKPGGDLLGAPGREPPTPTTGAAPLRRALVVAAPVLLLAMTVVRPWWARRDAFADRHAELAAGRAVAAARGAGERALVATADLGHFAVVVGAGGPHHAEALRDLDPRRAQPVLPADPEALARELAARRAHWLVAGHDTAVARLSAPPWFGAAVDVAGFRVARLVSTPR